MISYTNKNGVSTGWLSRNPTVEELKKLTVEQLLIIARRKSGFKTALLNFLKDTTLK